MTLTPRPSQDDAQERHGPFNHRDPHPTRPVRVWADVDLGVADMVAYLNTIPGVRTVASCQGTIGEGGPFPYRAQVMAHWTAESEARLLAEFDCTMLGEQWGYLHPRDGWSAPSQEDVRALLDELRNPDFAGPMQHLRSWSEIDRLMNEAAAAIRAILGGEL